jgi:hypothetical protein
MNLSITHQLCFPNVSAFRALFRCFGVSGDRAVNRAVNREQQAKRWQGVGLGASLMEKIKSGLKKNLVAFQLIIELVLMLGIRISETRRHGMSTHRSHLAASGCPWPSGWSLGYHDPSQSDPAQTGVASPHCPAEGGCSP